MSGAWAKPFAARKFHYFHDGRRSALCDAYTTAQVAPSRFGPGLPEIERCPTCVRKLAYYERRAAGGEQTP